MSDPVSKAEIEDVLSSIRRLVSDDARVKPRRVESREPAAADRLVLTQSLRVAEDAAASRLAPVPEVETVRDEAPDDAPWRDPGATLFASARAARLGKAGTVPDEALEIAEITADHDDGGETGDWEEDDVTVEAEWHDDDADSAGDDDTDASEAADDFDDDFTDDFDEPAEIPEADGFAPEDADGPPTEPEEDWDEDRVGTLTSKIQALEAAIGQTRDRWEPDGDSDDDYAGTPVETIEWEDHGNEAGPAAAEPPRPRPEIDDAPDFSDDTFLDEDSLRELVADIVRQELMGALGERITRNVRKLVRREIHRALTAQELD